MVRRALLRIAPAGLLLLAGATPAASRPLTRHDLANRCFVLRSAATGRDVPGRFFLKPSGLGTYLPDDQDGKLLAVSGSDGVERVDAPGVRTEWRALRVS